MGGLLFGTCRDQPRRLYEQTCFAAYRPDGRNVAVDRSTGTVDGAGGGSHDVDPGRGRHNPSNRSRRHSQSGATRRYRNCRSHCALGSRQSPPVCCHYAFCQHACCNQRQRTGGQHRLDVGCNGFDSGYGCPVSAWTDAPCACRPKLRIWRRDQAGESFASTCKKTFKFTEEIS